MATPIINNLVLHAGRCLIRVDEDSNTTGVIFKVSESGFRRLVEGQPIPENGTPQPSAIPYAHVLFIKESSTEVEVNGVEYLAMHQNNIVGLIPD